MQQCGKGKFLFFHNISRFYVICSMRTTKLYNIFVLSKLMICMGLTNSVLLENRSLSLCIRNPLHMQSLCIKEWCSRRGLLVFYFFYFFFLQVISLAKGRTKKKNCRYRPDFKKIVKQRCSHFESGCKGKNFIPYTPNKSEVFFHFSF